MTKLRTSRLAAQQLNRRDYSGIVDVLEWFSGFAATDLDGSKWGLAARVGSTAASAIDQAIADGKLLRTPAMRGDMVLFAPDDIRCVIKLVAPPVIAANAEVYKSLELDDETFEKSNAVIERVIDAAGPRTREELVAALEAADISTDGGRADYLIQRAGIDSRICGGPLRDGEHTWALMDDRVAPLDMPPREIIASELAKRYFRSRGPATFEDFVYWSGLPESEATAGLANAKRHLEAIELDGTTYWMRQNAPDVGSGGGTAHLLPADDEYVTAYRDLSTVAGDHADAITDNGSTRPVVVIDSEIVGTWSHDVGAGAVSVDVSYFGEVTDAQRDAVAAAAKRFGDYLGLAVELS